MKKILHIISQYPGRTGSGIYLNQLIKEGYKKNYKQALIGAINSGDGFTSSYIDDENLHLLEFNRGELNFYLPGMSDEMPYKSKKYRDMKKEEVEIYKRHFKNIISRVVEEFKPDIIFTHHLWIVSSLVKELVGDTKVVGICHGTDIRQYKEVDGLTKDIRAGCKKLDLVLALNKSQKKEIETYYKIEAEKILVVGGGYSREVFYPDFKTKDKLGIVYAGKISYAKGLLPGLRAIEKVDKKYNFKLSLVGTGVGEQYEDILELANEIDREVEFLGELSQKELASVFRKNHIFLMPSYYEGLSLVTIEALGSGLLVVSNRLKGLQEFLGSEINESGIISYTDIDGSDTSKEPLYIEDLKRKIEEQLERVASREVIYRKVEKEIGDRSWEEIYGYITEYTNKL